MSVAIYPLNLFNWYKYGKVLTAEASELPSFEFNHNCFKIKSHKTGKVVTFLRYSVEYDAIEGELHWVEYRTNDVSANISKLLVFND